MDSLDPKDIVLTETILTGQALIEEAHRQFEWNHEPEVTLVAERLRRANQPVRPPDERTLL